MSRGFVCMSGDCIPGDCVCMPRDCVYMSGGRVCMPGDCVYVSEGWLVPCGEKESHTPHQQCRFMSGPELGFGHCNSVLVPLSPAPAPASSQSPWTRDLSV